MYLLRRYRLSTTYYTGKKETPFERGIQGNSTAGITFFLFNIILIQHLLYSSKYIKVSYSAISSIAY